MITCDTLLWFSMLCCSTVVIFASNKGPLNYLKILVNNKKTDKSVQTLPINRVASTNPAIVAGHGTPTGMTFRDVYLHVMTDVPRSSTTDYGSNNQVKAGGDKRTVNGDKTVTKHREDDALVQRMCSDIMSAMYRKINEQSTGLVTSGTTVHQKSEKRLRYSYRKISPRPVGYYERKDSSSVTIGPNERYHDPIFAQESSRVDYLTSYPLAKSCNGVGAVEEEYDDRWDEDVDQAPKVWKLNMAGEHAMFKSAKSREQQSDDDDDDQTL